MNLRAHQKLVVGITVMVLSNVIMIALFLSGSLYVAQSYVNDIVMQFSKQTIDDRIVIVAIDDQSVADLGRLGSWNRTVYAQVIANLKDAGARVVAFDVYFDPPIPQQDINVARAIAYAQSDANGTPPMPVILATVGDGEVGREAGRGVVYQDFLPPSNVMTAARPEIANVTVQPDGSEVRHLPLVAVSEKQRYFLLPMAAVNDYLRRPPINTDAKLIDGGIQALGYTIPTDSSYRMLINFEGRPQAFTHYSVSQVAMGKVDPAKFKDKLVFVGAFAASTLADNYPVPTSNGVKMDGVEIWANGAQNLLNGKFVAPQGAVTTLAFMVALSAIGATGFFLSGAIGWLIAIGTLAIYGAAAWFITLARLNSAPTEAQIIPLPNMVYIGANVLLSSVLLFMWFFIYEQRRRKAINQIFGKYLTPAVAKHVMEQQEQGELGLGGSIKDATIMFGDIRGFTTLSEGMEPEEVMAMLNRYFDRMVDIVEEHGGTVSKFIGDNIMVMFNLPMQSRENHALAAAKAGFEIQEWIRDYRAANPDEKAQFGFGISSGDLVAGNMGSEERMEYTVIGDPVREADELCATALANEVAISETTFERIKDSGLSVEDKGLVTIKGKTEEIHMYVIRGLQQAA